MTGAVATLVSVNVGLPADVPWHDVTVHTGIWKTPVKGRRMVRRLNIDGDGQGDLEGHGGEHRAVLVYQLDSYRYWREQLGRSDLTAGDFGENLTVDGLADGDVCVGDRYRIGDALFEVSQPRVTCYRLGIRVGEPVARHARLRHLEEGIADAVPVPHAHVAVGQAVDREVLAEVAGREIGTAELLTPVPVRVQLVHQDGDFGENLTVDGLADGDVCVGDRYRIGDALFEVSQPRVTCYRLGIRVGEPRLPALLVSHRRPGFYMRVLNEGQLQAGDAVFKVASGPERLTVAEVDGLLYLHDHPRDDLVRALKVDALSPGWKASLAALLEQAGVSGSATGNPGLTTVGPPPAWEGFRPLRVAEVDRETETVTSLRLAATDGAALPAPLPGQYLTVRLVLDSGQSLVRNYSLSGPPGDPEYRISVKREPHGLVSGHIHASVRTGQIIDVAAPRGTFTLVSGAGPLALVSAGVGVTPVLAMLHALAVDSSTRPVYWIHGARSQTEDAFADEVARLLATLPGARWSTCYSAPSLTDAPDQPGVTSGRVTAAVVEQLGVPSDADVYLCGPAAFMTDMTAAFHALGFAPTHVHTETFGTLGAITPGVVNSREGPPRLPDGPPGTGPAVTFGRSGLTARWADHYHSVLELAEACGVPVRWSCRTGVCHTCETSLVSGDVAYEPEPVDRPAQGNVLICCAQPGGDLVVDL